VRGRREPAKGKGRFQACVGGRIRYFGDASNSVRAIRRSSRLNLKHPSNWAQRQNDELPRRPRPMLIMALSPMSHRSKIRRSHSRTGGLRIKNSHCRNGAELELFPPRGSRHPMPPKTISFDLLDEACLRCRGVTRRKSCSAKTPTNNGVLDAEGKNDGMLDNGRRGILAAGAWSTFLRSNKPAKSISAPTGPRRESTFQSV